MVMMFKIPVLERLYNLSDDQAEFQINDRRSFMRFLDLESYDTVPDAKTIWKLRDDLSKTNAIEECFICLTKTVRTKSVKKVTGAAL